MSNEKVLDSDLELEEKLAVAVVLLLAGLFLWQFWENEDKVAQIFQTDTEEEIVDTSAFFYKEEIKSVNEVIRRAPPVYRERVITKNQPEIDSIPSVALETNKTKSPVITTEVLPIVESVKIIEEVIPVPEPEPVPMEKIVATPTIQMVSGDFSKGLISLSGTGEPENILHLLVNGNVTANIGIDKEGFWSYETILKPGDYSLQVLMPEQGDANQSPKTHITIPQPSVTEIKEKVVKAVEIIEVDPVLIKPEVLPAKLEVKPDITPVTDKASQIPVIDKVQEIQKPTDNGDLYRVRYGDTLNKLSRRYNLTVAEIAKINNISDKDLISVGQMLIIPGQ